MNALRWAMCRLGLHVWRPTGVWRYTDSDAGTIYTCRCGRTEDAPGDVTGFEMDLPERETPE